MTISRRHFRGCARRDLELVAGVPLKGGEKDFDLKVVQAGKAPGARTWHGVEHTVFSETIMPSFSRFLMMTPEWQERQEHLLGGSATSRGGSSAPSDLPTGANVTAPSTSGITPPAAKTHKKKPSQKAAKKRVSTAADGDLFETETETETEDEDEHDEEIGSSDDDDDEDEEELQQLCTSLPDGVEVPSADDLGFNEAMVRKLDAMPENERRLFLWLHRNNSEYDIQCMNTRAANDELLRSLGVDADFLAPKKQAAKKLAKKTSPSAKQKGVTVPGRRSARLNKEVEPVAPSSSPSPTPSGPQPNAPKEPARVTEAPAPAGVAPRAAAPEPAPHSSATPMPGTDTSSSPTGSPAPDTTGVSSMPAGSESSAQEAHGSTSSAVPHSSSPDPVQPQSSAASGTIEMEVDSNPESLASMDTAEWPDWGKNAFAHFTEQLYSAEFTRAVHLWATLESGYGWEKSVKGYRAQLRPTAIGDWMRLDRRVHAKVPKLPPVEEYAASWWAWWLSLQPDWRVIDGAGRPVATGDGPWDLLVQPGQNGMLVVLLSLVWWHGMATGPLKNDWNAAVHDVAWVLSQMVQAKVEAPSKKRKAATDASPDKPVPKRAKRK